MLNVSQDLKLLEIQFPNKELIYIEDATRFVQDIVKTNVKNEFIVKYLKQKGYKRIEKKPLKAEPVLPIEDDDDDFDLDDFLEANKGPEIQLQNSGRKCRFYQGNSEMIQTYHTSHDENIYSDLVNKNIGLVQKEASKLQNWMKHKLSYDDLVQEGIFGLMKAIDRFDSSLGNQFSTYATWWIRQSIFRAICNKGATVRIPVHMIEQVNKMRKIERQSMKNENVINKQFVCQTLNITKEKYEQLKMIENNFFKISSLNGIVSEEDDDTELLEFISNEHAERLGINMEEYQDPYLNIERLDLYDKLYSSLDKLRERERDVLIERFGLKGGHEKTLEEVGKIFGVTRERIRQIEAKALRHLRYLIRKKEWASSLTN